MRGTGCLPSRPAVDEVGAVYRVVADCPGLVDRGVVRGEGAGAAPVPAYTANFEQFGHSGENERDQGDLRSDHAVLSRPNRAGAF